jgi:p24 family protein alpha
VTDLASKVKDLNAKIEEIRKEQQFQREREIEFRALSDKTNRGAIWWSFIQLAALLGSCAWQLRHLKVSITGRYLEVNSQPSFNRNFSNLRRFFNFSSNRF